jgi:hypothetical protein
LRRTDETTWALALLVALFFAAAVAFFAAFFFTGAFPAVFRGAAFFTVFLVFFGADTLRVPAFFTVFFAGFRATFFNAAFLAVLFGVAFFLAVIAFLVGAFLTVFLRVAAFFFARPATAFLAGAGFFFLTFATGFVFPAGLAVFFLAFDAVREPLFRLADFAEARPASRAGSSARIASTPGRCPAEEDDVLPVVKGSWKLWSEPVIFRSSPADYVNPLPYLVPINYRPHFPLK